MLPFITYFKLSNIFADVTVEEVKAEILAHAAEFNFNRKTLEDTNTTENTTEDTTISNITFHKYSVYDFPPSNKNDIIHYYLEHTPQINTLPLKQQPSEFSQFIQQILLLSTLSLKTS